MFTFDSECTCEELFLAGQGRAVSRWREALASGVDAPVALILDLRDRDGRWVAECLGRAPETDECLADARRRDAAPVFIGCVPRRAARAPLAELSRAVAGDLDSAYPAGGFLVAVVAGGRVSLHSMRKV
jgi:hypothetical protein